MSEKQETIFVVHSPMTAEQQEQALTYFRQANLLVTIADRDYIVESKVREAERQDDLYPPGLYRLEEIRSKEQFITREHIIDFSSQYLGDKISYNEAILAFGALVLPYKRYSN